MFDMLQTERLVLRKPVADDIDRYAAFAASERSQYVGGPFDKVRAFEKLSAMRGHWELCGWGRYVIELDTRPVGHCGPLEVFGDMPEMTWTLWDEAAAGKGVATEAVREVLRHMSEDCGWNALKICISPENTASHRMALRIDATLSDEPGPERWPEAQTYYWRKGVA